MSASSTDERPPFELEGHPKVRRFSSLLEYLERCASGVIINELTLDCVITKLSDGRWGLQDEESSHHPE